MQIEITMTFQSMIPALINAIDDTVSFLAPSHVTATSRASGLTKPPHRTRRVFSRRCVQKNQKNMYIIYIYIYILLIIDWYGNIKDSRIVYCVSAQFWHRKETHSNKHTETSNLQNDDINLQMSNQGLRNQLEGRSPTKTELGAEVLITAVAMAAGQIEAWISTSTPFGHFQKETKKTFKN